MEATAQVIPHPLDSENNNLKIKPLSFDPRSSPARVGMYVRRLVFRRALAQGMKERCMSLSLTVKI